MAAERAAECKYFNPRSREGSDEKGCKNNRHRKTFQSTLPRGERPWKRAGFLSCRNISIHAPARGATKGVVLMIIKYIISIHAPARGATTSHVTSRVTECISIHAPARGATKVINTDSALVLFQSTLPRGERLQNLFTGF